MSKPLAQRVPIYYTHVSDLLQEVQRETPPPLPLVVRLERMTLEASGWRIWGVSITALTDETIHAAWMVVGKSHRVMLTPYKQQHMDVEQLGLYTRLVADAEQRGFTVRPGSVLPPADFFASAVLPADLPARDGEGGQE